MELAFKIRKRVFKLLQHLIATATLLILLQQGAFSQSPVAEIDSMMTAAATDGLFNGVIVVVDKGTVVYKKGFGYADEQKKIKNDEHTAFNLCSISKQFTAMAVMMLEAQGKIRLEDELSTYIPELPYKGITLRHLLIHTSGLPDYMILAMNYWPEGNNYSNKEAIDLLVKYKPPVQFPPGERFQYSNTGYMLLAAIIEKTSGTSYASFLENEIFKPLGMKNSFVYTPLNNEKNKPNVAKGYVFERLKAASVESDQSAFFGKQVKTIIYPLGDGGVFSTASDMIKWHDALKSNQLLKQELIQRAFSSGKLNDGRDANYGFGWFIVNDPANGKVIQHTGGWPGFRNAFIRTLEKDRMLLVLRNNEVEFRGIQPAINSILENKPYNMPQSSLGYAFAFAADKGGPLIIREIYRKLKGQSVINEEEINEIGYGLFAKGFTKHALEVMKINTELFPKSWNAFDSLGELYLKTGNKEEAKINYQKSLELNPQNTNAKKIIDTL